MKLSWRRLGSPRRVALIAVGVVLLIGFWWLSRPDDRGFEASRDRLLELRRPGAWANVVRTPKGIASPYGEMSGFASSKKYPGVVWGIRDSGNPAVLYALVPAGDPGRFNVGEVEVRGTRNRDWEDLVYSEDQRGTSLLIIDAGAKMIHRVPEPDPSVRSPISVTESYAYEFADRAKASCGPSDNVEAAFLYPALNGPLHLVRKEKGPARVYRFDTLSPTRRNIPRSVGLFDQESCISVAAVSFDSTTMVTASHSSLRVRQGVPGDLTSFLKARPLLTARISPDNNEGGDFFPFGSDEILIGAENRTTWRFSHRK